MLIDSSQLPRMRDCPMRFPSIDTFSFDDIGLRLKCWGLYGRWHRLRVAYYVAITVRGRMIGTLWLGWWLGYDS